MRIKRVKERLSDLREFIVELKGDPSGKECKSFDHALDMRIFDLLFIEKQPGRDLRIFARKIRSHPAKEDQFALVVSQELVAHKRQLELASIPAEAARIVQLK